MDIKTNTIRELTIGELDEVGGGVSVGGGGGVSIGGLPGLGSLLGGIEKLGGELAQGLSGFLKGAAGDIGGFLGSL